ncbi:MAG TPA: sn-glycerol-3-phosphate ABC transporter ATP-binding protein UgpC [Bacillota bacterium]
MAELRLKNIRKVFDKDIVAVDNFNLHVKDKEFIVLVGPSGCGKSTTLRMIAGLEEITKGQLYIDDQLMNDVAPKDRNIAMVFQNYALYPHMSVYENMAFSLKLRKFKKAEIDQRVKHAANILGLENYLDRKPKALSGGQRQRVALGRAIVREANVFLMDEPLSNLDAKLRVQMRAEITKLHQRLQTTTIYVTHDQTEAMTMATRLVVMKDGFIQQVGEPKHVYDFPDNIFVGNFIGSPPMNFLRGKILDGSFVIGELNIKIPENKLQPLHEQNYVGKHVILGIRPENIRDHSTVTPVPSKTTIKAKIDVAELMGAETFLYFTIDNQSIIARIDSRTNVQRKEWMKLTFNMDYAHFFDEHSERRIK